MASCIDLASHPLQSIFALSVVIFSLAGCSDPKAEVRISYDTWEVLDPRALPPESERARVSRLIAQGNGPQIAVGDLVQVKLHTLVPPGKTSPLRTGDVTGWIWVGFNGETPDEFRVWDNAFQAALVGLHQGSTATFVYRDFPYPPERRVAYPDWGDRAGAISIPVFGDSQWFELERKRMQSLGSYRAQMEVNGRGMIFADISPEKEMTEVTVERVCNGQAQKRLITMTVTKPIRVAQDLGRTFTMKEPRYRYAREAEWEGTCNDGAKARFQYGPIFVSTPRGKPDDHALDNEPYEWVHQGWEKIPFGVVLTSGGSK
jgi:hypothetical protein